VLHPRGVLALCPVDGGAAAEARFAQARTDGLRAPVPIVDVDPAEVTAHCPILRPGWVRRAMLRPGAQDIDVDGLHQGYLRGVAGSGGRLVRRARVRALRWRRDRWHAETDAGEFTAPVVVNAAGAWADEVALLAGVAPVGLTPLRRTAFVVDAPPGMDVSGWPMVAAVTDTFYFRPESGGLLVSPADVTPSPPVDARPEDIDVAIGAERVQEATTLRIRHIRRAWAGLRTVAPDDTPVLGPAPGHRGFHWLAGLGGYGVQISPVVGRLVAALATGGTPAEPGVDLARLTPNRRSLQSV
jgi:D-arginine dehydrogenase